MPETEEKELTEVEKEAREKVGDGKLPNRYFVCVSQNYYYFHHDSDGAACADWISDLKLPGFTDGYECVKAFDTYREAREFVEEIIPLGYKYHDVKVHCVYIEDRLSGQLFERAFYFSPDDATVTEETIADTDFTREAMEKLGAKFE